MKRNILVAFDAFSTLITPRAPIAVQYTEIAQKHGLTGLKTESVQEAFKNGKVTLRIKMLKALFLK